MPSFVIQLARESPLIFQNHYRNFPTKNTLFVIYLEENSVKVSLLNSIRFLRKKTTKGRTSVQPHSALRPWITCAMFVIQLARESPLISSKLHSQFPHQNFLVCYISRRKICESFIPELYLVFEKKKKSRTYVKRRRLVHKLRPMFVIHTHDALRTSKRFISGDIFDT